MLTERERRLSTVDLLIEIVCFVKKKKIAQYEKLLA